MPIIWPYHILLGVFLTPFTFRTRKENKNPLKFAKAFDMLSWEREIFVSNIVSNPPCVRISLSPWLLLIHLLAES